MARTFTFPRPRPRGLLGRKLDGDEQLVLGAGFLGGLAAVWLVDSVLLRLLGFAAIAGGSAWATLAPYRGRTYLKWFEINRTYGRLLRDGTLLYRSQAPYAGRHTNGRRLPIAAPPGVPHNMQWISARTAYGEIAVLLQPDELMFTAAVEVEAMRDFGSLDADDKESLIRAYEHLLKSTADGGGRVRRLQWITRVIPTDPNAHARDAAARRAPDTPAWLDHSYGELIRQVAVTAEDRRLILVLGIPYTTELVAEARRYATLHEGYAAVLGKEIEAFARSLPRGQLRHVRNLDESALASYLHHAYDPAHWIDDTTGMDRVTAWPAELDARAHDHLASRSWEASTDAWYSRTAWVKEWPVLPAGVNFLAPLLLYVQDVILSVAVTMHLVPPDQAITEAMADATSELGQADKRASRIEDPREQKAQQASIATMREIADGAAGVRFTGWVTVTSPSRDALRRDADTVRNGAARSGLRLEWCDREHYRAFANTLPFAGGMLKEGR
ncbi:SCO6880 family protein [Streptomyces sp. RFCAC02]|uniref:SCO6880 family protein n=1 Tax=Streptomyces sp. RFCAC02 TaxID=2499143 RepID=UPI001F105D97|nr:SCO6880 family protein [Streptomyces sp. RFCAC02]